jgi:DinB superfamily
MRLRIGVENNFEGRSLAWALEFPGCFAYGSDGGDAIIQVPEAFLRYKEWIDSHIIDSWLKDVQDIDVHLEDTFDTYSIDDQFDIVMQGVEINNWFRHDWKPLTEEDIRRGLLVLQWSREDLLELVSGLNEPQLNRRFEGERWSILEILGHIAGAENWYLNRLSRATPLQMNETLDVFGRLQATRNHLNSVLPTFYGVKDVRGIEGEFWSPRKVLRRASWHEIDHIDHILKLIALL